MRSSRWLRSSRSVASPSRSTSSSPRRRSRAPCQPASTPTSFVSASRPWLHCRTRCRAPSRRRASSSGGARSSRQAASSGWKTRTSASSSARAVRPPSSSSTLPPPQASSSPQGSTWIAWRVGAAPSASRSSWTARSYVPAPARRYARRRCLPPLRMTPARGQERSRLRQTEGAIAVRSPSLFGLASAYGDHLAATDEDLRGERPPVVAARHRVAVRPCIEQGDHARRVCRKRVRAEVIRALADRAYDPPREGRVSVTHGIHGDDPMARLVERRSQEIVHTGIDHQPTLTRVADGPLRRHLVLQDRREQHPVRRDERATRLDGAASRSPMSA